MKKRRFGSDLPDLKNKAYKTNSPNSGPPETLYNNLRGNRIKQGSYFMSNIFLTDT